MVELITDTTTLDRILDSFNVKNRRKRWRLAKEPSIDDLIRHGNLQGELGLALEYGHKRIYAYNGGKTGVSNCKRTVNLRLHNHPDEPELQIFPSADDAIYIAKGKFNIEYIITPQGVSQVTYIGKWKIESKYTERKTKISFQIKERVGLRSKEIIEVADKTSKEACNILRERLRDYDAPVAISHMPCLPKKQRLTPKERSMYHCDITFLPWQDFARLYAKQGFWKVFSQDFDWSKVDYDSLRKAA